MRFQLLIIFYFFSLFYSFGQNYPKGTPYIKNFSSLEYNYENQNWCFACDKAGIIYFGNNAGVLMFDGVHWSLIELSNKSVVRSLGYGADNKIYVGGNNDLGVLSTDSLGKTVFHSFLDKLPLEQKEFGDVWKILTAKDSSVYFAGNQFLFVYKNGNIKKIKTFSDNSSHYFIFEDTLLGSLSLDGLFYLKDSNYVKINGTEKYIDEDTRVLSINKDESIIINRKQSAIINFKKYFEKSKDYIFPFCFENISEVIDKKIFGSAYDSITRKIAFATIGGVFVFDLQGNLLNKLTKESGLLTNTSFSLGFDNYSNLWIASDKGVSCVFVNSPFSLLTKSAGVGESNLAISEYKRQLFLSSMTEIKKTDSITGKFKIIHSQLNNFSQIIFPIPEDSVLFFSSNRSVFYTFGKTFEKLFDSKITLDLTRIPKFPNRLFYGTIVGEFFVDLTFEKNKVIASAPIKLPEVSGMVNSAVPDSKGDLWISTYFSGVYKIQFVNDTFLVSKYDTTQGLPEMSGNIVYYDKFQKEVLFATNKGVYWYNPELDFIVKHPIFSSLFFDKNPVAVTNITINKDKVLVTSKAGLIGFLRHGNQYICDSISYKHIPPAVFTGSKNLIDHAGNEWITTINNIVIHHVGNDHFEKTPLGINISKVFVNENKILAEGYDDKSNLHPELSFKDNTISFEYALPYPWGVNKYSYFLDGYSSKWSMLSGDPKVRFINLKPGNYVFHVVGINIYGNKSPEAVFRFVISPPWYRTLYAYISYVLLLILLIFGIVKILVYRYKKANEHLEAIVAERTEELKHKNQMITDSIQYAKRIQQSMLPGSYQLNNSIVESFVFFQPRDIVSGDFYWQKETSEAYFYVVADCTGHGVPGAFVSMIGNTLLNQFIAVDLDYSPAEILKKIAVEMKTVFSAENDEVTQADGMDVSVCKVFKNKPLVQIAQANRLAILKQKNTYKIIEGDIYSIGEPFSIPVGKQFTNVEFTYDETTTIYLFTDGFADQFDKNNNQKYKFTRFQKLIEKVSKLSIGEQTQALSEEFLEWKGNRPQIDDVTVLGIKLRNVDISE